jgi:hypothetical protein
MFSHVT